MNEVKLDHLHQYQMQRFNLQGQRPELTKLKKLFVKNNVKVLGQDSNGLIVDFMGTKVSARKRLLDMMNKAGFKSESRLSRAEKLIESLSQAESLPVKMLSRLKQDCEYFLGAGNRKVKHLWASSVDAQIKEMKKIWNQLDEKPEWLTMKDIEKYAKDMKG